MINILKKKSKKKKIIIGITIFLLILTIGGIAGVVGVNYTFDKIMDSAIDITPNETVQPTKVAASSPMLGATETPSPQVNTKSQDSQTSNVKSMTKKEISKLNKKGVAYDETYGEKKIDSGAVGTDKYNNPKKKNWNVTSIQLGTSINKKDIEKFKENASFGTKTQVVKYVMSRFSTSELNEMREISAGGITYPEKQRLHDIVYSKFSKAEIQELMKKYNNYK